MSHKFNGVLERIEEVRTDRGLSKSAFCRPFGMNPQTLNNFYGAQGSKPNIELITGVIEHYGVNPDWLLFGKNGGNGKGAVAPEQTEQAPPPRPKRQPGPGRMKHVEYHPSVGRDRHIQVLARVRVHGGWLVLLGWRRFGFQQTEDWVHYPDAKGKWDAEFGEAGA